MDVISYADARVSLKAVMDRVIRDRVEIIVTGKKHGAVVMMSLDEYTSIQETLHLQKSRTNAQRLRAAIAQLDGPCAD